MIKKSLQESYRRWVAEGKQPDWWDGLDESMLEVNFYVDTDMLEVNVYQNVVPSYVNEWIETRTDRWAEVTRWLELKEEGA